MVPHEPDPSVVALHDVRGASIGNHNVQINTFKVTARDAVEFDFEEALNRYLVKSAINELQRDPTDPGRRSALANALSSRGWLATFEPASLQVRTNSGGLLDFLTRLLAFDVQGCQVGDHNTQRNTFTYLVTDSPQGSDLLHGNDDLAKALVGCLFPLDFQQDLTSVKDELNRAVSQVPVDWTGNRSLGVSRPSPGATEYLRFRRIDGLMVGDNTTQQNIETIEIDAAPLNLQAPLLNQKPTVASQSSGAELSPSPLGPLGPLEGRSDIRGSSNVNDNPGDFDR
ncbi:hypothetical protein V6W11_12545 [Micromonospora profundi]|uniref:hypothetical protein n=1 Tax=Micromonospora profundi TaxID=1420889 RepID=UPI002FF39201